MSETSLSPALTRAFEDRVDLGSWAGFTSSLARFLDEVCRPAPPGRHRAGGLAGGNDGRRKHPQDGGGEQGFRALPLVVKIFL